MQLFDFAIIGLTLLACVSPLLTTAKLFQIKEWRFDRIKEHLRREGYVRQLFGITRPGIILIALVATFFIEGSWLFGSLGLLIGLSVVQFALNKQPMPVLTRKTVILLVLSIVLTVIKLIGWVWLFGRSGMVLFPLAPLFQFAFLTVALLLWMPIDMAQKKKIFDRVTVLRKKYPDLTVIGITGSAGKTTTKELTKHLLQDVEPLVTPEHVNTELGVALWLEKNIEQLSSTKKSVVVVEMGDYRTGELELMGSFLQPTMGVVTLVGPEHLALFGSMEAVTESKRELLRALPKNGRAFLNGDSEGCRSIGHVAQCPVTYVGTTPDTNMQATNIVTDEHGIHFSVNGQAYSCTLQGAHQITNILLAMGVAQAVGISNERISALLKTFQTMTHTFHVRREGTVLLLDDTYNATPMSMEAGIAWANAQKETPKTLFTSGILEMGYKEDEIHRNLGEKAKGVFDRVIFMEQAGSNAFAKGFGKPVEIMQVGMKPVEQNSLLACIGRVPLSKVRALINE